MLPACRTEGKEEAPPPFALAQGDVEGFLHGEYCLSNYIECEELRNVPIDPEPGKQRHGQFHHVLGLGDNNRLPFEAAKPMTLATMIALDPIRPGFAHDQSLGWDHRSIHRPVVGTVEHYPVWSNNSKSGTSYRI